MPYGVTKETQAKRKFQPRTMYALREVQGISQMDLARAAGIRNRISVYRWEKEDDPSTPSDKQLELIAEKLGVKVDVFFEEMDYEWRTLFETDLKAFCIRVFDSENPQEQRLALEIWKHLFPDPVEIKEKIDKSVRSALAQAFMTNGKSDNDK